MWNRALAKAHKRIAPWRRAVERPSTQALPPPPCTCDRAPLLGRRPPRRRAPRRALSRAPPGQAPAGRRAPLAPAQAPWLTLGVRHAVADPPLTWAPPTVPARG